MAKEELQRVKEERLQREQARIDLLLSDAAALQQAETIRSYVSAAQHANCALDRPAPNAELDKWVKWALEQADRIDPVFSRNFVKTVPDDKE